MAKNKIKIGVYYSLVSLESSKDGNIEERGTLIQESAHNCLRSCINKLLSTRSLAGYEVQECMHHIQISPLGHQLWFSVLNYTGSSVDYSETREISIKNITEASARRLASLLARFCE